MAENLDYSQQRSLNVGIAMDTGSIGAAAIYDDLVYAQKVFGNGFFYRSYDQMMKRFPFWSERTIRNYIKTLEKSGWIRTKIKKIEGKPVCHYQICRFLSAKIAETIESENIAETYNDKETKKETESSTFSVGASENLGPASTARARALMPQLIEIINPKEKMTADRLRVLNGRLNDYTEEEIIGAARAFSKSDWHRENKQMSIDNLIAPSKFGRWYAQRPAVDADTARAKMEADIEEEERLAEEFRRGNK